MKRLAIIPFLLFTVIALGQKKIDLRELHTSFKGNVGFVLIDDFHKETYVYNEDMVSRSLPPGATFQLFTSLVALETNLITDPTASDYEYDGLKGRTTSSLKSAFIKADITFFMDISQKIKNKKMRKYMETSNYGNQKYNGTWNELKDDEKSVRITALQQVKFLKRLDNQTLRDFTEKSQRETVRLLINKDSLNYKYSHVYGGLGDASKLHDWNIGIVKQNGKKYYFAAILEVKAPYTKDKLIFKHEFTKNVLRKFKLLDYEAIELEKQRQKRIADSIAKVKADTIYNLGSFYGNNPNLKREVDDVLSKMTDAEMAGQMIVPAGGRWGNRASDLEKGIKEKKIGGILMLKGEKNEIKKLISKYNNLAKEHGSLPLMYSSDAEPSLLNRKISGLPTYPKTNTIKTEAKSSEVAGNICKALKEIGIQVNYAPDCDLGINKAIIGNRSYGNDTKTVAKLSQAFIDKSTEENILTTAKHFPGHGLVKGDSHHDLVFIEGEMKELDTYQRLIEGGVLSIMVGHIAVEKNEFSTKKLPASCSKRIVTDLLQTELGFKGLIITDGMGMGALKKIDNASLEAVKAGNDLILMPTDPLKLHSDILSEMKKSVEFRENVVKSVRKIVRLKKCLSLM